MEGSLWIRLKESFREKEELFIMSNMSFYLKFFVNLRKWYEKPFFCVTKQLGFTLIG